MQVVVEFKAKDLMVAPVFMLLDFMSKLAEVAEQEQEDILHIVVVSVTQPIMMVMVEMANNRL
jgi:hypothetical protein